MLKFTKRHKLQGTRDHFKRTWLFLKKISYLQVILMFFQRKMVLEMDFLTSSIPLQEAFSCIYQFCTEVYVSSRLSLSDDWTKCKQKVTDMSDSNQNLETTINFKLKLAEFKGFSSKGYCITS